MVQDEKKTILEEIKELLNALEDELSVISLQYNLPLNEQIFISQTATKMRTNLELLAIEENER